MGPGRPNGITLEVRGPHYLRLVGLVVLDLVTQSTDVPSDGPRVVAIDQSGNEHIVSQCMSMHQAREAAAALEEELAQVGETEWCTRHGLPASFLP